MNRIATGVLAAGLIAGCAAGGLMAGEPIVNPHLTTDRAVDTSSVKAMVASLVKPGMSEQDKALAVYQYVRRTMFHYRYLTKYAGGGTMDLINGVGYCLCTPTAGTQARLASEAGLKGHVLTTPGHGSVTVFFDGKWHWMDAFLGGCVWNKDRTAIASLEEIVADPSLLKRDNPSPVPLLPCRDVLYADSLRFEPENTKYHGECGPDDFAWTARATPGKSQPMVWDDVSTLNITLRPGEAYSREWDHQPGMYFLFKTEEKFAPPHHFCGVEAEQRDTVNWPYFKPYVKEIASFEPKTGKPVTVKTGRYWANGRLTWSPRMDDADLLRHFARAENVQVKDNAFVPADASKLAALAGKPAVLEWKVDCPYMLQGGMVWFDARASKGVTVSIGAEPSRGDKAASKLPAATFERLAFLPAKVAVFADLRPHFVKKMGTRSYTLRIELAGQDARLVGLRLETIFQHNMYALPQLMPGNNEVKVVLGNPEALKTTQFAVEYAWDGPDGAPKTERRVIDRSPFTFTIEIPDGPDLPRMRRLVFANDG